MLSTGHVKLAGASKESGPRWFGPVAARKLVGKAAVQLDLPQHIRLHVVVHVTHEKPYGVDDRSYEVWLRRPQFR